MIIEAIHKRRNPGIYGFCIGNLCGLVIITPACGYVPLWSNFVIAPIGTLAAYMFCYFRKKKWEKIFDDTLDVFGVHGITALWGGIAVGLFADPDINNKTGLFFGNPSLLGK